MYVILNLAGIQKQQNLANQSFFFPFSAAIMDLLISLKN